MTVSVKHHLTQSLCIRLSQVSAGLIPTQPQWKKGRFNFIIYNIMDAHKFVCFDVVSKVL